MTELVTRRFQEAKNYLLFNSPLFSEFILASRFVFNSHVNGLASVVPRSSHIEVSINTQICEALGITAAEFVCILRHEYWHIILNHCTSKPSRSVLWNIACDIAVNQDPFVDFNYFSDSRRLSTLCYTYVNPPRLGKKQYELDPALSAEAYYNILKSHLKESDLSLDDLLKFDEHSWDEADPKVWESFVRRVVNYAVSCGEFGPSLLEAVHVAWTRHERLHNILRGIVSHYTSPTSEHEQITFARPNRRNPTLPGFKLVNHAQIVWATDTSASMSTEQLSEILSVAAWISRRYNVTFLECDTVVQEVPFVRQGQHTVSGRGGTSFAPVFDYIFKRFRNKIDLLIYATDLAGEFPESAPPYPTLWLVHTTEVTNAPPFGKCIKF